MLVNEDSRKLGETDHRSPIKTTRTIGTRIESRARIHALAISTRMKDACGMIDILFIELEKY